MPNDASPMARDVRLIREAIVDGGSGGDSGTKDSYLVFLSSNDILVYEDGETDVALLPSDIPSDNGLISIIYVEPDAEIPTYHYYYLTSVRLDLSTMTPSAIYFKGASDTKVFVYNATAGGFTASGASE